MCFTPIQILERDVVSESMVYTSGEYERCVTAMKGNTTREYR